MPKGRPRQRVCLDPRETWSNHLAAELEYWSVQSVIAARRIRALTTRLVEYRERHGMDAPKEE